MKKRKFDVNVIAYNADTFRANYAAYIVAEDVDGFDDVTFSMVAPESTYNEIDGLKEECIEILAPEARKIGAADCFMPAWKGLDAIVKSKNMEAVVTHFWENKCICSDTFYTIDENDFNRDYLEDGEVVLENDSYLLTYDESLYPALFLYEKEKMTA